MGKSKNANVDASNTLKEIKDFVRSQKLDIKVKGKGVNKATILADIAKSLMAAKKAASKLKKRSVKRKNQHADEGRPTKKSKTTAGGDKKKGKKKATSGGGKKEQKAIEAKIKKMEAALEKAKNQFVKAEADNVKKIEKLEAQLEKAGEAKTKLRNDLKLSKGVVAETTKTSEKLAKSAEKETEKLRMKQIDLQEELEQATEANKKLKKKMAEHKKKNKGKKEKVTGVSDKIKKLQERITELELMNEEAISDVADLEIKLDVKKAVLVEKQKESVTLKTKNEDAKKRGMEKVEKAHQRIKALIADFSLLINDSEVDREHLTSAITKSLETELAVLKSHIPEDFAEKKDTLAEDIKTLNAELEKVGYDGFGIEEKMANSLANWNRNRPLLMVVNPNMTQELYNDAKTKYKEAKKMHRANKKRKSMFDNSLLTAADELNELKQSMSIESFELDCLIENKLELESFLKSMKAKVINMPKPVETMEEDSKTETPATDSPPSDQGSESYTSANASSEDVSPMVTTEPSIETSDNEGGMETEPAVIVHKIADTPVETPAETPSNEPAQEMIILGVESEMISEMVTETQTTESTTPENEPTAVGGFRDSPMRGTKTGAQIINSRPADNMETPQTEEVKPVVEDAPMEAKEADVETPTEEVKETEEVKPAAPTEATNEVEPAGEAKSVVVDEAPMDTDEFKPVAAEDSSAVAGEIPVGDAPAEAAKEASSTPVNDNPMADDASTKDNEDLSTSKSAAKVSVVTDATMYKDVTVPAVTEVDNQ